MTAPSERPLATRLLELFADAPKFTHDQSSKMLQHGWNGVYVMFEEGQTLADGRLRVTRVGSHREPRELRRRLEENAQTGKMAQVGFRRQVASAIMKLAGSEQSTIEAAVSQKTFPHHIDVKVTDYLRQHCSYTVMVTGRDMDTLFGKDTPWLEIEKRLIGQLANALPMPSPEWLGYSALDKKIRESGLWNSTNLTAGWTRGVCAPDDKLLEYVMEAFESR